MKLLFNISLIVSLTMSCARDDVFALTAVTPSTIVAGVPTHLRLSGSGFVSFAHVDYRDGLRVSDEVAVRIGDRGAAAKIVDDREITVEVVPEAPGLYDVQVQLPDGRRAQLDDALDVVPKTVGDVPFAPDVGDAGVPADVGGTSNSEMPVVSPPDDVTTPPDEAPVQTLAPTVLPHLDVTLDDGELQRTIEVEGGPNVVPFVSVRVSSETTNIADRLVDVYFQDQQTLVVERGGDRGAVDVAIELVSFDASDVAVHSGSLSLNPGAVELREANGVSAASASFVVFGYRSSGGWANASDIMVRGRVDGDGVWFQRDHRGSAIEGHYWVIESLDGRFSTVTTELSLTQGAATTELDGWSGSAAALYSYSSSEFVYVRCSIDDTAGRARCDGNKGAQSTIVWLQLVDLGAAANVTHGSVDFAPQVSTRTVALPSGGQSTLFSGVLGMYGVTWYLPGTSTSDAGAFATLQLEGSNLVARRSDDSNRAFIAYQIVGWR